MEKTFSVIANAVYKLEADNFTLWEANNALQMRTTFEPYLNYIKKCDATTDCWSGMTSNYDKTSNINVLEIGGSTKNSSAILADGTFVVFHSDNNSENNSWIMVDVNGIKPPNTFGKDIFGLRLFFVDDYYAIPFSYVEMGKCNPPTIGTAGSPYLGLGCGHYYLYDK